MVLDGVKVTSKVMDSVGPSVIGRDGASVRVKEDACVPVIVAPVISTLVSASLVNVTVCGWLVVPFTPLKTSSAGVVSSAGDDPGAGLTFVTRTTTSW